MSWQTDTINPAVTSPAVDITKITNDLQILRDTFENNLDPDVPVVLDATKLVGLVPSASLDISIASTAEAVAGTNNTNFMTPLRTAEQRNATALGWGQTWQDVSGSRTAGVTYTNSTGRPIMVSIRTQAVVADFTISVSGLVVAHASGSTTTRSQLITVVPDGSTYVVSGFQGGSWVELR